VVAVKAALRNRTGVWFGWSGKIDETETAEPRIVQRNHIAYAVIDLSKNDFEEYYKGLANRALWPVLHYRVDLQEYSRADHSGYSVSIASSPTSSQPSSGGTTSFGCTTTT
jgi:trehalose 6-phosphate synthase